MNRRISKEVKIGNIAIGGNNPVAVQSMLNVNASNVEKNVEQAIKLQQAGCEIVRVCVPNMESVRLIDAIKSKIDIPLVADIHFDYRLALESANAGVDKIRINPGNIGDDSRVKQVAQLCMQKNIPIRVGVNSGSVEKHILEKYGKPSAEALVESAFYHTSLLEKFGFNDIVISIKSSNVQTMVNAYELLADKCDYPLHLGVTEAGSMRMGVVKSSIGIGSLLLKGIGDTIRVSLTADPVKEIPAGFDILKAVGLKNDSPTIISCPTCGRTKIDLINLVAQVEERLENCKKPITVAVMGCVVNGPGEAKEADIGIAGGDGVGILIKKGEIIRKIPEENLVDELISEIEMM